ncbi:MAG: translocation/assembly module TamB domain-containing protein [Desulfohalobiaceae bacterium]
MPRAVLHILVGLAGVLLLVLMALLVLLRTDWGHSQLERGLNQILARGEQEVRINGLQGALPFQLQLQELSISDNQGKWLQLRGLELGWSLRDILQRKVVVKHLRARELEVLRAPDSEAAQEPRQEEPEDFDWPLQPALGLELQELQLARISLGEELIGTEADFSLQAHLGLQRTGGLQAELDVHGLDRPELLLRARAEYQPQSEKDLDLDLRFQDQGLLQEILPDAGLPGDVSLRVSGKGQGNSWQGQAGLDAPGLVSLDTDLDLGLKDGISVGFTGGLEVNQDLAPKQLQAFVGDQANFQGRLQLDTDKQRLHLQGLQLQLPGLEAKLQAGADLTHRTLQGNLQLSLWDPGALLVGTGLQAESLELQALFSGPWSGPEVKLDLEGRGVEGEVFSLQKLSLETGLNLDEGAESRLDANGKGSLQGLELAGLAGTRDLDLEYDLGLQGEQLVLSSLRLQSGRDELQAENLRLDLESLELGSKLKVRLASLDAWMQGEDLPQAGLMLETELQGNLRELDLQADFQGSILDLADLPEQALLMTGPELDLSGRVELNQGQELQLQGLQLQGREFAMQAAAQLQLQEMLLQADLDLQLPKLQAWAAQEGIDLQGGARLSAQLQGELPRLDADVSLQGQELMLQQQKLDLDLGLQARDVLQKPQGSLELDVGALGEELKLGTDYVLQDKLLQVAGLRLSGAGTELAGDLELNLEQVLISGQVQGEAQDLSRLGRIAGQDLQGSLALDLELYSRQASQQAKLGIGLEQLQAQGIILDRLESGLEVRDALQQPEVDGDFRLQGLQSGELELSELEGDLAWAGHILSLNAQCRGSFMHPLQLDLGLELQPGLQGQAHQLSVQHMQGKYQEREIRLQQPLLAKFSQQQVSWQELSLQYGEGSLSSHGSLGQEQIEGRIEVQDLLLQDLPLQQFSKLQGKLGGSLELAGSGSRPRLQGAIRLSELRTLDLAKKEFSGLEVDTRLSYELGKLKLSSQAWAGEKNAGSLELNVPLRLSLQPFAAQLQKEAELQGVIQADGQLQQLGYLLLPEGQLLQGRMHLDAEIKGKMQRPKLHGLLRVNEASFEQPAQGILLQDILLEAKLQGESAKLQLKATDGARGRLQGQGDLVFGREEGLGLGLDLDLQNLRALSSKEVQAWLEQGRLQLQGDAQGGKLQGSLEFDRILAAVPQGGSPQVVHLEYTEKGDQKGDQQEEKQDQTQDQGSEPGFGLDLDLDLDFPARVYVRGSGLDSEWRGALKASGTAQSPKLTGKLELVRGHMMFLNKRFSLDQGSSITFSGASPPAPVLNITARHKGKELEGIVRITGPVEDLELELDSDPPMSQDQILARVLFGKDISQISPFQAVMLANAARKLATGGGMDLMGQVRSVLNVDSIDVQTDQETGGVQFGLGKYVHERVYMQVEKGTEPGSDEVSVEVELTPRLNLESSLESEGQGGLGLFWKLDY